MTLVRDIFSSKNPGGQYFIIGRVRSIVLGPESPGYESPADLGKIDYEIMYSPRGQAKIFRGSISGNKPAYPIHGFLRQYPVENEYVLIMSGPSPDLSEDNNAQFLYYFPPYSLWNDMNHNGLPDFQDYTNHVNEKNQKPGYSGNNDTYVPLPLGDTFTEKYVRTIKPFEGDTIVQSRFGQSIRFGSTVKLGSKGLNPWSNSSYSKPNDPITILVNSQGNRAGSQKFDPMTENIYLDGSSIYMTSTQEIEFGAGVIEKFPKSSFQDDFLVANSFNYQSTEVQNTVDTTIESAVEQDKLSLNVAS